MAWLRRSVLVIASSMVLSACNCGDDFLPDASVPDAGHDAGVPSPDAGPADAGVDAGHPDAGEDAGVVDAGATDAGQGDAGSPDAGQDDAGSPDAGFDAGPADAGFDAGNPTQYDDAGCPLPTGLTLDAADAGVPSAGLVLWLRADLAAVTRAGIVCRWDDVSGKGNHLLQSTAFLPTFNDAGINGEATVTFRNQNQYLAIGGVLGIAPTSGRTIAAVMLSHDTTSRSQPILFGEGGSPGTYFGLDENTWQTAGSLEGIYVTNNSFDSDLPTAAVPRTYVMSVASLTPGVPLLTNNAVYSIDGLSRGLTLRAGNGVANDFSAANYLAVGAAANAELGDVLIYDRELTTSERAQVEAELRARYHLTKADAGPYDSSGCPWPTGLVLDPADAGLPSTGLKLWLRADLASVTRAGKVCRWDDVSGNGNSVVPATNTPPDWNDAGINGQPSITFVNGLQYLARGDVLGIGPTSGRTIAAIALTHDTTSRFEPLLMGQGGTGGTYFGLDSNTFATSGSKEGVYVTNNAYDSDLPTTTAARTHLVSLSTFVPGVSILPTTLRYFADGVERPLTRTGGGTGNGLIEDFSGANFVTVGYAQNAELGDVLVYDHELTASERAAVEAYFRARYLISATKRLTTR
jgi:hypothetical protein